MNCEYSYIYVPTIFRIYIHMHNSGFKFVNVLVNLSLKKFYFHIFWNMIKREKFRVWFSFEFTIFKCIYQKWSNEERSDPNKPSLCLDQLKRTNFVLWVSEKRISASLELTVTNLKKSGSKSLLSIWLPDNQIFIKQSHLLLNLSE